ncbi:syntaxin-like isoform X3 [Dermatophagoides pteronyssinus]|uniref:syntaxin-like isoform X3 n=1 Tax=Dermatophagoides pteronyssinus TaxID=6956 RepID=UPI003F666963
MRDPSSAGWQHLKKQYKKMVRDRLAEFKERAGINDDNEQEQCTVIISSMDMEKFIEKVENVRQIIRQMENLIKEMKDLHSQILLSAKPDERMKKKLEDININFKMLSKKTKENLKSLEIDCQTQNDRNSASYRMRTVQYQTLRQQLLDVINAYNSEQVEYRTKCKELLRRQITITNQVIDNEELDKILDNPSSEIFIQGLLTETREAREKLEEIQARHEDILKIEKSIRELHEMFVDMATLVENQGEMINRIESHVQETHDYVEKGREETKTGNGISNKSSKVQNLHCNHFDRFGNADSLGIILLIIFISIMLSSIRF